MILLMLLCATAPMPPEPAHHQVAVKTTVSRIKLIWDPQVVDTFLLSWGSAPGVYTNTIATGASNSYTLVITNWAERFVPHWFNIQAKTGAVVSPFSGREVRYPPYPVNTSLLSWAMTNKPVTLTASTNIAIPQPWPVLATVSGTNSYSTPMIEHQVFTSPNVRLSITTYNPLN